MRAAAPLVVARMTLLDLLRRRAAVAILVALPLAFYLVRHDAPGQSIRSLVFGISWAMSTVAFFAALSAHEVEPRLLLSGWSRRVLIGGRLLGLLGLGAVLSAAYVVLVALDRPVAAPGYLVADFVVTSMVAVAIGTALGSVVHRELEGALVIFFIAGLQAVVNPLDRTAKMLPLWSSRELATAAVDGPNAASAVDGALHALVVVALCAAVVAIAERRRGARWRAPRRTLTPSSRSR